MHAPKRHTVSHTLSLPTLRRTGRIAFRESISRSSIVEYAVRALLAQYSTDKELGGVLRDAGVRRRQHG